MSDTNAPEPTMEEILASIRRIISEDDAPASDAAEAAVSPGDPPQPPVTAASPAPATAMSMSSPPSEPARTDHGASSGEGAGEGSSDDVLELTERVEPEASSRPEPPAPPAAAPPPASLGSLGDLDFAAPEPAAAPRPAQTQPQGRASAPDAPLVSAGAAGRAADHFGALASSLTMPAAGRTLEDVVRELLRPLLAEWLDQHLAGIVEARVQDEVERISRRRTY